MYIFTKLLTNWSGLSIQKGAILHALRMSANMGTNTCHYVTEFYFISYSKSLDDTPMFVSIIVIIISTLSIIVQKGFIFTVKVKKIKIK